MTILNLGLFLLALALTGAGVQTYRRVRRHRRWRHEDDLVREARRVRVEERRALLALAEQIYDEHPLTRDRLHDPRCIHDSLGRGACSACDRGDAILAALRGRLAADPRGEYVVVSQAGAAIHVEERVSTSEERRRFDIGNLDLGGPTR